MTFEQIKAQYLKFLTEFHQADDYRAACPALDRLVELERKFPEQIRKISAKTAVTLDGKAVFTES